MRYGIYPSKYRVCLSLELRFAGVWQRIGLVEARGAVRVGVTRGDFLRFLTAGVVGWTNYFLSGVRGARGACF